MISIITGEFTMLILRKYGFNVSVILFGFYSIHYKVYIHLPFINAHQQKTAPFNITSFISSCNRQMPRLYQRSDNCCKGNRNSKIIRLIQTSQTIHYCNQLVLSIVPDLNIFFFIITIFDLTSRSAMVQFLSIMCKILA